MSREAQNRLYNKFVILSLERDIIMKCHVFLKVL